MHTHRSGRLIKLARNVHLSRFRAPNKDFIDFFYSLFRIVRNGIESTKTGIGLSVFDVIETLCLVQSSHPLVSCCCWCYCYFFFHPLFLCPLESRFSLFCEVSGCVSSPPSFFLLYGIAITLIIANGWSEKSVRLNARKRNIREMNW